MAIQARHYKYIIGALAATSSVLVFLFTPPWLVQGRRGGSLLIGLSLLPILIVYTIFMIYTIAKKSRQNKLLAEEIAKKDALWTLQSISLRIEATFFALQKAMQGKNASGVQTYVSEKFLSKLDKLLKQELNDPTEHVREDIVLNKHTIVSIEDYRDDSKDCLWAMVSFSMHSYAVDKQTGQQTTPKTLPKVKQRYKELWKFIRHPEKGWVLDDIDETVQLSELIALHSFSESCANKQTDTMSDEVGKALVDYEWCLQKDIKIPDVPSINSPVLALAIGLLAPWLVILLFFLRVVLNSD